MIVYSHEEGLMKPAPAVFRIACDRLGVRPEETAFLDDLAGHVEAATALGMHAIRFLDNAAGDRGTGGDAQEPVAAIKGGCRARCSWRSHRIVASSPAS